MKGTLKSIGPRFLLRQRPPTKARAFFASQAQTGAWSSLSADEQAAWKTFHYDRDSWERRRPAPEWKQWDRLTLEEKAAAMYGLKIHNQKEWDQAAPSFHGDIPPLSSLLLEDSDDDENDETANALVVAQETRLARQQQQQQQSNWLGQMAYSTIKGLAPVAGPLLRNAANHSRGALGLSLAGSLLESLPTIMDASSGVLHITGIDTLIYLDDSASMAGSNLREGQKALQSLEQRLKADDDQRFLPTRIVKFGIHPTILNPSEEDWNASLVNFAWDGSSGGTYMWKMIQDDIQARYRPAGGKLRIVVITDGYDNISPSPYNGVRGFDPLMQTLLQLGYDIEWNIIVVGNNSPGAMLQMHPELSTRDQELYKNLCEATGGHFLSLGAGGWDEDDNQVANFLEAVEDSGFYDSEQDRRERQERYQIDARRGKADKFDWLPTLSDKHDDKQ
ncbi:expressed unknown protein [Seminavis robusta]|uniref:VWFA domain-containing protein n=1 Tax=Seminavis robusta TaxID=568900 RepID=A0A9N8E800_9STRA|nr:expressed unknown protein [Seminavis robusta]|eukprot:Sro782_g201690.1 n/a (448) ;mRNA; r:5670-7013